MTINLFHALNPAEPDLFTPRGNVTVTNLNSGKFSVSQAALSRQDQSQLKALAQANRIYRLKAVVVGSDGEESAFLTFSKAVNILRIESGIKDNIFNGIVFAFSVLWPTPI